MSQIAFYDPAERQREKERHRASDASALLGGSVSQDELRAQRLLFFARDRRFLDRGPRGVRLNDGMLAPEIVHDLAGILELSDKAFIVGGQALNLWAGRYGTLEELAA